MIDEDVSNTYYLDADTDGYGNKNEAYKACSKPGGYVATSTDCDDTNKSIYPGAVETCNGRTKLQQHGRRRSGQDLMRRRRWGRLRSVLEHREGLFDPSSSTPPAARTSTGWTKHG